MLEIILWTLWKLALIAACFAAIIFFTAVIIAIIDGLFDIRNTRIARRKFRDKNLQDLQENFDAFMEALKKETEEKNIDKDKQE